MNSSTLLTVFLCLLLFFYELNRPMLLYELNFRCRTRNMSLREIKGRTRIIADVRKIITPTQNIFNAERTSFPYS